MAILNTNNKITLAFYMTKAAEYLAKAKRLIETCKNDPKILEEIQTAIGYAKYYENQTEAIIGAKLIKADIADQVPDTDDGEEDDEAKQLPPRTLRNTMRTAIDAAKAVCSGCGYNTGKPRDPFYKCLGSQGCPASNRKSKKHSRWVFTRKG